MKYRLTKQIEKQIIELAKMLPKTATLYDSFQFQELPNKDLQHIRAKSFFDNDNPIVLTEKRKVVKVETKRYWNVNHVRRLRKTFETNGVEGVKSYIDWVKLNNKDIMSIREQTIAMSIIEQINVNIL